MKEIVIIGGGASGMAAAISVAQQGQAHVTLLERQARVGKKLSATGNGRCNLTNLNANVSHYHGADPGFVQHTLSTWPPERVLEFFAGLGLRTVTEYGGRVFPMSDHAGSVRDVLRLALERANVTLRCGSPVTALRREKGGFLVDCGEERLRAERVIVACGGCIFSFGAIMPAPFVMPPMRTVAPPISNDTARCFGTVSVVIMARAAVSPPSAESSLTHISTPFSMMSIGIGTPIRPVDETRTCDG